MASPICLVRPLPRFHWDSLVMQDGMNITNAHCLVTRTCMERRQGSSLQRLPSRMLLLAKEIARNAPVTGICCCVTVARSCDSLGRPVPKSQKRVRPCVRRYLD